MFAGPRTLDEDVFQIGDALFGRGLRLAVALWIWHCDAGRFYQSELVGELPAKARTAVPAELRRLAELGMIEGEDPEDGQRRKYFTRTASPLWDVIRATDEAIGLLKDGEATAVPPQTAAPL